MKIIQNNIKMNDTTQQNVSTLAPGQTNTNSEKQIPLNDLQNRCNTSSVIKYTVQEGENLHNISKKFSISKDLIRSSNNLTHHVHPGDTLKIYLDIDSLADTEPIDVVHYNQNGKSTHDKGKLMIKDYSLSFHPHSITHHPIKASIFGHLESSIVQNPSSVYFQKSHHHSSANFASTNFNEKSDSQNQEDLSVLSVEYLNDDDILMRDYFIGPRADIENFQNKLSAISSMTKQTPEIYTPEKLNARNQPIFKRRQQHGSFSFHAIKNLNQQSEEKKPHEAPPQIPQPEPVLNDIVISGKSNVFTEDQLYQFRKQLPKCYRNSNWSCLFQTRIHGFSLSTVFSRTAKKCPLVLFIKTTDAEIIGAFIYSGLKISDKYYGDYETFVFRFNPNIEFFNWDIRKPNSNRYFVLSNLDCISFGASSEKGEGSAIFIKKDLSYGYSEACNTFSSPQLSSSQKFDIEELEIWDIGMNSQYMF